MSSQICSRRSTGTTICLHPQRTRFRWQSSRPQEWEALQQTASYLSSPRWGKSIESIPPFLDGLAALIREWFNTHCLCYSIEIEVQYYQKEKEMLTKVESVIITAKDAPLRDVLSSLMKVRCMSTTCIPTALPLVTTDLPSCCHWAMHGIIIIIMLLQKFGKSVKADESGDSKSICCYAGDISVSHMTLLIARGIIL